MDDLSYDKLMYVACLWGSEQANKAGMDIDDLMLHLGHLACMHATTKNYLDETYRSIVR